MCEKIWKIVKDEYVILKSKDPSSFNVEKNLSNHQVMNILFVTLGVGGLNRIKNLKAANEIWVKLMKICEGTTMVKNVKLFVKQD
jgi:hypothetical protein